MNNYQSPNLQPTTRSREINSIPASRARQTSVSGVLELHPKGYGFLRQPERNFVQREDDIFVPQSIINHFRLRPGNQVTGHAGNPANKRSGCRLVSIEEVDGIAANSYCEVALFEELTATNPLKQLKLENPVQPVSMRVLDLLCPIGLGQRALIASPPKAGKSTILKQIGHSISTNYPEIELMALLIDERPEEVTDMRSEINGQVFSSSLDQNAVSHARLSQLVVNRCQRLAESGKDVFLLVDSLTRMSRAFNKLPGMSGPIGAGGLNIRALEVPKRLFAAARPFREGGSLTIVASVLIETDNRMDEVIFREFKGTGNWDLVLGQSIADRRIWPAIDIAQSGTRRVELLHDERTMRAVTALRNTLLSMNPVDAMRELTSKLERFPSNTEFIQLINGSL